MHSGDFDLKALYEALDAQRAARTLTWSQVARELSRAFARTPARPVSASTITGIRGRQEVEGDGVLQMLIWLDRTPESFVPGCPQPEAASGALPRPGPGQVLRWNACAIHAALDARRLERGMTWTQVASEIGGHTPAMLTRMAKGGRVSMPGVMRIVRWLGLPAASFTHLTDF